MSDDIVISVENVSKAYRIWEDPGARLKSPLLDGMARLLPSGSTGRNRLQSKAAAYYRDFYALKDISFQVRKGESIGIIGRNGSGKSTLLQIIVGTLQPTTGSVNVQGRVAALLELGSGFNPDFTGRENVYLNGAVLGLSRVETDAKFDAIAAFADIGEFLDQPVKTYSSGMLVRLAFAVQIQLEPEILIVDEALAVGDEPFQRKCYNEIALMKERGVTILFVSHAASAVIELCERAILLDHGEQLLAGPPKLVVQHYHQLCYATAETLTTIRAEVAKIGAALLVQPPSPKPTIRVANNGPVHSTAESTDDPANAEVRAYFLEAMEPASRTVFSCRGAEISEARVLDASYQPVNVLIKGHTYALRWIVRFTQDADRVRFGWTLKTISGIILSGAASHVVADGFGHFPAGVVCEITFRFRCLFNPGTYFIDLGVRGMREEPDVLLHGINDALMFKVQPVPREHRNGYVDCSAEPVWAVTPLDGTSPTPT